MYEMKKIFVLFILETHINLQKTYIFSKFVKLRSVLVEQLYGVFSYRMNYFPAI